MVYYGGEEGILSFCLPSKEETLFLGKALGEAFKEALYLAGSPKTLTPLVVSLYGKCGSGKTTLLKGLCDSLSISDFPSDPVFKTGPAVVDETEKNGFLYRYIDMGCNTCYHNHLSHEAMFEPGPLVPRAIERFGIDFIEHPSIPHLEDSGIIILSGNPDKTEHSRIVLNNRPENIRYLKLKKKEMISFLKRDLQKTKESVCVPRAIVQIDAMIRCLYKEDTPFADSGETRYISVQMVPMERMSRVFSAFQKHVYLNDLSQHLVT